MFKVRRTLVVVGGSVQMGADVNLYRSAANLLATDDAFQVGGTAYLVGATKFGAQVTFGSAALVQNEGSVAPTLTIHGDFQRAHVLGSPLNMYFRSGGTTYSIAFQAATHGTITCTIA